MFDFRSKDTFGFGLLVGLATMSVSFGIFALARMLNSEISLVREFNQLPGGLMFSLLISILFFRFIMVTRKQEETGKGFLFAITVLTMTGYLLYKKFAHS